ncbi:hypothetical protein OH492_08630 [Vibrio chagasii]|nr:hypothetical protein [Vibrio chagasii]
MVHRLYTSSEERQFIPADSRLSFMLIYPELRSIYPQVPFLSPVSFFIRLALPWDSPTGKAFEFQLSLIEQAKMAPLFERQLKQIRQYQSRQQWQELDILLLTPSSII